MSAWVEPTESPVSRAALLRNATSLLDEIHRLSLARHEAVGAVGAELISVARAYRNAAALSAASRVGQAVEPSVVERARGALWRARQQTASWRAHRTRPWRRPAPRSSRTVLVVPRERNHFRDLVPIALLLARVHGARPLFLIVNPAHLALLEGTGLAAHVLTEFTGVLTHGAWRVQRELDAVVGEVARDRHASDMLLPWVRQALRDNLTSFLRVTEGLRTVLVRRRPGLVLVGNPCTAEGRIAAAAARGYGVPSAALQHGDVGVSDPLWTELGIDWMGVWGEHSRDQLLANGVPATRLCTVGAPWLDDARQPMGPTRDGGVLVATSGAGHTVGSDEHLADIRLMLHAAAQTPELAWTFRLHPKDDRRLYPTSHANVSVMHVNDGGPSLEQQLARAQVLVTVTSTSALDAMRLGVPVVTLERPAGEPATGYASAGATHRAASADQLTSLVRALVAGRGDKEVAPRAQAYARRFYGPLDGRAAERTACALSQLAGWR